MTTPFYALISGFHPEDVPGVGTFYDFQDRLLKRLLQPRTAQRRPYQRRGHRVTILTDLLDLTTEQVCQLRTYRWVVEIEFRGSPSCRLTGSSPIARMV